MVAQFAPQRLAAHSHTDICFDSRHIAIQSPALLSSGECREHALDDHGRRIHQILHRIYGDSGQCQNGIPLSRTCEHYPANDLSFGP